MCLDSALCFPPFKLWSLCNNYWPKSCWSFQHPNTVSHSYFSRDALFLPPALLLFSHPLPSHGWHIVFPLSLPCSTLRIHCRLSRRLPDEAAASQQMQVKPFRQQQLLWTLVDPLGTKVGWRLRTGTISFNNYKQLSEKSGVGKKVFSLHSCIYLKRQQPPLASSLLSGRDLPRDLWRKVSDTSLRKTPRPQK